ncbi:MAG: cell wall metabolism sensor histidine kinase WalK [Candidatus Desulfofervidus auxilii]|nr:cell wall metabolism sensor histidine kinase WalK [Candidatus Desulfofervidus auxilii]
MIRKILIKENLKLNFDLDFFADEIGKALGVRVTIVDISGKVVADSEVSRENLKYLENHSNRPEILSALKKNIGISKRYSTTLKQEMLYVALPLIKKEKLLGTVRLALPLVDVERIIFQAKRIALISLGLGLLMAIIISFLLSHSFARPIKKITETATAMAKGDFKKRIGIYPKNEIGILAYTIDDLARTVEQYISQLNQEKGYLETILKSIYEGIVVTDKNGEIVLYNDTFKLLFPKVEIGKSSIEILRDEKLVKGIEEVIKGKERLSIELVLFHPKERVFEVHLCGIKHNTKTIGSIAIFYDITHLKRLERMRRDFVANVSHELRTPLTSIKGYAETLLYEEDIEKIKEFSSIILKHTDFLIKLTHDLIELSTIESEGFRLKKEHVSLKELIEETIETFKEKVKRKDIKIELKIKDTQTIWANEERARQVFNNLIDNALKYTEKGKIEINAEEQGRFMIIKVSDTGIGIPKKDLTRIFERFYRVNKERSRASGSTGLGLSIVKHIVEAHGGEVWAESELGKGSTFFVKWPR